MELRLSAGQNLESKSVKLDLIGPSAQAARVEALWCFAIRLALRRGGPTHPARFARGFPPRPAG
jgi:hypothetical protein